MKAIMFPGQGSQYRGMGKEIFPKFKEELMLASEILGYDVEALCVQDPERKLNKTQYTQPALYTVNALLYKDLLKGSTANPDFLLGHSLGEYNALLAAEVFDFETGLRLVQKRGALMSKATGGGMAAVLGISAEELKKIISNEEGLQGIDVANYNTPTQTVLAGTMDAIVSAVKVFDKREIKCIPLNVSAPFHSRYMEEASKEFYDFLNSFSLTSPKIQVIANVTAKPYEENVGVIKKVLGSQIASSVKWNDSVAYLLDKEVLNFEEIGPQGILNKMVAEIKKNYQPKPKLSNQDNGKAIESQSIINSKYSGKSIGSTLFKKDYGLEYAYVAGSMYRGIASKELVVKMATSGLMSYLGTGGMDLSMIEENIIEIQRAIGNKKPYGMNLLCNIQEPHKEMETVDLFLKYDVDKVEASGFMQITPALVYYRLNGIFTDSDGIIKCSHKIMAKISRPEVAELFMKPAPEQIVKALVEQGLITEEQARMSSKIPMSNEICIEADSGGHTDGAIPTVLMPSIRVLRDQMQKEYSYSNPILLGQAGGIGTPDAAASAFVMGADFILTGSVNQCSPEAGISNTVKEILQNINVQDTEYAPAGDMFEIGARVQVLKKGTLFSPRANKLYHLYNQYNGLEEIPDKVLSQLENVFFKKKLQDIWEETKSYKLKNGKAEEVQKAEANPKTKMGMIFKWYFSHSMRITFEGDIAKKINYQVHTGPALGAFNQWVKGTDLEQWQNRNVDLIGIKIMEETSKILKERLENIIK